MQNLSLLRRFFVLSCLGLFLTLPLENGGAVAQQSSELVEFNAMEVDYHKLSLLKIRAISDAGDFTKAEELKVSPLTTVEENMARNLNSHWAWRENTLEMIDSYSTFLFRTKKSQELDEVKVVLLVNSKGRVAGFELLGSTDKGLKERLDHLIRKLPDCKPVPGYMSYSPEKFEMTIRK
ncbi:hypothetical protein [Algoriphagus terrigena]|uniref:hypothetical protein n=1 Tax=Algoriphagus terrigena TaxID=344884 RepID=UPI000683E561|nr:hypothetical protein [Algoriphagus terrigena]